MKKNYRYIVCCFLLWLWAGISVSAKNAFGYTEQHPLTVVCDWDFSPYEFLNAQGEPAGCNVEILDLIFNNLGIPHRFVMQEWSVATRMFEERKVDLIHALDSHYAHEPYVRTKKYINYYNLRVARRMSTPAVRRISDLDHRNTVVFKKNDYADLQLSDSVRLPFDKIYLSAKEALTNVAKGRYQYFIWGEVTLHRKIQELGLDSIVLDRIDIPAGELRIIGYDKALIDLLDDQYTRLEQAGELQKIYERWFHPERVHDDASPMALYILGGLLVVGLIAFLLSRITSVRVKKAVRRSSDLNNIMHQALDMGEYYVMEYDIQTGRVSNVYGNLLPAEGVSIDDFVGRVSAEEREGFRESLEQMKRGEKSQWTVRKRFNAGTAEEPNWRRLYGNVILEYVGKRPRYIVNTVKDLTRETEMDERNQELAVKYQKIFKTSLMAMSFYDASGRLIDYNEKMAELCVFDEKSERYFRETSMFEAPSLKGIYPPGCREQLTVCQTLSIPEIGIHKYVEITITPTVDEDDSLAYYLISSRDVTEERQMFLQLREHDGQLQLTNERISSYEQQLRYLLEESNMYVWQFDIASGQINFFRTLGKIDFSISIQQYFEAMKAEEREEAERSLKLMKTKSVPFNTVHHFDYTPINPEPSWYALSGTAVCDAGGRPTGYYGLARNVTVLMDTQQRLRQERSRAEDSGLLKSAFLANMTHEIRTPLNAIVGFSGLLQMIDAPEERKEFLRIIRNNCDMLLRLINDILEASNMGQAMSIEPKDIDLATIFNDICQTLEQRVAETGIPFVKDNPYDHCQATLDKGRVQQILTNFVTNAVKYTKEGHIRVGYRREERDGRQGLYFYCEDTGAGIPKDKQAAVFERFVKLNDYVQGTGLGLSICKAIIDRCDGHIGVDSEGPGHGSTFWFWVPQA